MIKKKLGIRNLVLQTSQEKSKVFTLQEKAIVHVKSLLNNTFVTLTTLDGKPYLVFGEVLKALKVLDVPRVIPPN